MKVVSPADIFIQGQPCAAGTPVEVEDSFATEPIANRIVRALTDAEIATFASIPSSPAITRETYASTDGDAIAAPTS